MRIEHFSSPTKILWEGWIGTAIVWELILGESSSDLQLTHVGLAPSFECYEICIAGWKQLLIA